MTNGDLLRRLFESYVEQDVAGFRAAAETVIHEERLRNHRILADDLERILLRRGASLAVRRPASNITQELPKDRDRGFPLVDLANYDLSWDRIVLAPRALELLRQIAAENHRRDILVASGLAPKRRLLFYGPPGVGKTLAAKVLASVLGLPLMTVRFDAVVSSFLGETAANLRRVFEFAQSGSWVILFDEFDALGKDRDNPFEHGELKRVVNSLLQSMDAFYSDGLLIAATNHEGLLDDAVWRRFEVVVHFKPPNQQERVLLIRRFLRGFDTTELSLVNIARRLSGATGADIEYIVVEAARRAVLRGQQAISEEDVSAGIKLFRERVTAVRQTAAQRGGEPRGRAAGGLDGEG